MHICSVSKYSFKDVLKITFPLILSALAWALMMSVDRIVLGCFSIKSMNAAALVGNYIAGINLLFGSTASIATVFVGQYNGECKLEKVSRPVWQMIYLSFFAALICIPASFFTEQLCILPEIYRSDGIPYQSILTFCVWQIPMYMALASFFIGRGKTVLVTVVNCLSNILNLILDILLVFGVDGVIPSMGTSGAAIATVISQLIGLIVLFIFFFSKKNRKTYNTCDCAFRLKLFLDCIKIGAPISLDRILNIGAWFLIFLFLGYASNDLATIESITISVYLLFCCYTEGINKGVSTITANLIGENKVREVSKIFNMFMKMNAMFCLLISIPLVFYQDILFFFIYKMNGNVEHLRPEFSFTFYVLFLIIFVDGIFWMIWGVLAAGGDTIWPMFVNTSLLWVCVLVPVAIMYYTGNLNSVREVNLLSALSSTLTAALFYIRYKKGGWKRKIV